MILRKTKSEKEVEIDFLRRLQFLIMWAVAWNKSTIRLDLKFDRRIEKLIA